MIAAVSLLIGLVGPAHASAEVDRRHALSTNPLKPVLGLVNLEYDVAVTPSVSVHLFGEYAVLRTQALERRDHPDAVGRIGVRWFPRAEDRCEGVVVGANLGSTYFHGGDVSWFAGGELGYRWFGTDRLFLLPHALGGWGPPGPTLGFEMMVGLAL